MFAIKTLYLYKINEHVYYIKLQKKFIWPSHVKCILFWSRQFRILWCNNFFILKIPFSPLNFTGILSLISISELVKVKLKSAISKRTLALTPRTKVEHKSPVCSMLCLGRVSHLLKNSELTIQILTRKQSRILFQH